MLLDELALRTVVATASEVAKFGNIGKKSCIVTVENDLDQQVGIIVQGKAKGATDWHTAGANQNIAAGANGNWSIINAPWGEIRLQVTAAVLPATGTISAWINYA
jgi:hypothetical protein